MTKLRVNATVDQARATAERYANVAGQLASVEENRTAAIGATNAVADALARPLIELLDGLRVELEGWWLRNAADVTGGKRRSAELGGCMLGLRAGRAKLVFDRGDDKAAVAVLQEHRWAKQLVRVTYAVDKAATLKALDAGKHAGPLADLGFRAEGGTDTFFIDRVEQPGTATPV